MRTLLAVLLAALLASPSYASDLIDALQAHSVTVRAEGDMGTAQGSGTLIVRKIEGKDVTFVLTAGHVIDHMRKTREILDPKTGSKRTVVEFADPGIVQEYREDGRRVGEVVVDAKVLKYSDSETGEDLALLRVRKSNFLPPEVSAKFYLDEKIPALGTELWHVGSLLGQVGSNSLTTGVISQHGRVLTFDGGPVIFDQTTVTSFPGSSGGGVYIKETGLYAGMVVRGAVGGFNLIVPVRRINAWTKANKMEWVLDPKVATPTEAELAKMTIESGIEGGSSGKSEDAKAFKTLEIRSSNGPVWLELP